MKIKSKKRNLQNCTEEEGCRRSGKERRPIDSLKAIIDDYNKRHQKNLENYLQDISQGTIIDCIAGRLNEVQPLPDNSTDRYKKYLHQRRFTNKIINNAAKVFEKVVKKSFATFDELYEALKESRPKGIGPVAIYDFAIRYGLRQGLQPDEYVYIHAGTAKGLAALSKSGLSKYGHKILKSELPEELQHIASIDIENLLCIYKEELKQISNMNN